MSDDLKIYGDYIPGLKTYVNTKIENSPVPIHPYYAKMMSIRFQVGDLVETCVGKLGLVKEIEVKPKENSMFISEANNRYYKVMIGDEEKIYVGYSLKKIKKT
jgi:hypothetical protein